MVSLLNKWLIVPALMAVCLQPGSQLSKSHPSFSLSPIAPHPFHVSVVEINHNAADKSLEISCKIFTDDFEKVLAQNYKTKVDLIKPANKAAMDTLVKKYIFSHLSLRANGRPVSLSYVGFENESEAVYGYVEVDNIPSLSKIDITNSLMYDLFDDQVNIVHVIVNGNRKSNKLNYPEKELTVTY